MGAMREVERRSGGRRRRCHGRRVRLPSFVAPTRFGNLHERHQHPLGVIKGKRLARVEVDGERFVHAFGRSDRRSNRRTRYGPADTVGYEF